MPTQQTVGTLLVALALVLGVVFLAVNNADITNRTADRLAPWIAGTAAVVGALGISLSVGGQPTKKCPHCQTRIPVAATRCPNCTGEIS
jgi:hypothetical protein